MVLAPPSSHLLGGTACWVECWSSRTETSAHPHPLSSWGLFLVRICTPRNSGAWTGARPAPSQAPPPRLRTDRKTKDMAAQKIPGSSLTQRPKPPAACTCTHTSGGISWRRTVASNGGRIFTFTKNRKMKARVWEEPSLQQPIKTINASLLSSSSSFASPPPLIPSSFAAPVKET